MAIHNILNTAVLVQLPHHGSADETTASKSIRQPVHRQASVTLGPDQLIRASKILRITGTRRAPIFTVPSELRVEIYRHVLVETPLWYRRHQPGRQFYEPEAPYENPIFKMSAASYAESMSMCSVDDNAACKPFCQGRKGLSLLRTCRFIYDEAAPIFYGENLFCFGVMGNLDSALTTLCSIDRFPYRHIRRLSILEISFDPKLQLRRTHFLGFNTPQTDYFCSTLAKFGGLVELEMSPRLANLYDMWKSHPNLRITRACEMRRLEMRLEQERVVVYAMIGRSDRLHVCESSGYRFGRRTSWSTSSNEYVCGVCWMQQNLDEPWMHHGFSDWFTLGTPNSSWNRRSPCEEAISARLTSRGVPAHNPGTLNDMTIELPNGHKTDVQLLGLPVFNRDDRRRNMRSRLSNARRIRTQGPRIVELDSLELESLTLDTEKNHRALVKRTWPMLRQENQMAELVKEKEDKKVAREENERQDEAARKAAAGRARSKVKKAEEKFAQQKKALRKREGRR